MIDQSERRVTIPEDIWIALNRYTEDEKSNHPLFDVTPSAMVNGILRNHLKSLKYYPLIPKVEP